MISDKSLVEWGFVAEMALFLWVVCLSILAFALAFECIVVFSRLIMKSVKGFEIYQLVISLFDLLFSFRKH